MGLVFLVKPWYIRSQGGMMAYQVTITSVYTWFENQVERYPTKEMADAAVAEFNGLARQIGGQFEATYDGEVADADVYPSGAQLFQRVTFTPNSQVA
jgi:hypothetical protein